MFRARTYTREVLIPEGALLGVSRRHLFKVSFENEDKCFGKKSLPCIYNAKFMPSSKILGFTNQVITRQPNQIKPKALCTKWYLNIDVFENEIHFELGIFLCLLASSWKLKTWQSPAQCYITFFSCKNRNKCQALRLR